MRDEGFEWREESRAPSVSGRMGDSDCGLTDLSRFVVNHNCVPGTLHMWAAIELYFTGRMNAIAAKIGSGHLFSDS